MVAQIGRKEEPVGVHTVVAGVVCRAKAWPAVDRRWPTAVELTEEDDDAKISVARLWQAVTWTRTRCRRCTASRRSFWPGLTSRR
jgi:hypothetical protein